MDPRKKWDLYRMCLVFKLSLAGAQGVTKRCRLSLLIINKKNKIIYFPLHMV
jgi:hypothetical protein